LVTHDCASALIGGFTTEEAAAIKQVSLRHNIPFLIIDATADELTSDQTPTVFRLAPAASMIAQMPVQWLAALGDFNGDGNQQVLVLAENSASGDAALEQVDSVFPAAGIAYEVLRVDAPAADYSPLIARVVEREQAADVIFLYVMGDATLDLLRQLLDAGIGPQKGTLLVGGRAVLDGTQFWARVPDGAFTIASRRGPWHTSVTEMGVSFVERHQAYSVHWPEPVAFAAYDAIHLLADAAGRAPSISPADLLAALETTDVTLASGYYNFPFNSSNPPDGAAEGAYLWHQWRDPQLLYLQYREAQQDPATIDVLWPPRYRTVEEGALRPQ
jgi:ABC-type branched-subunit amino acid transport system substrate-binding protein